VSGPVKSFADLWRAICLADTELVALIGDRAYTSHISDVTGPVYPAASIYIPEEPKRAGVWYPPIVQMDAWATSKDVAAQIEARFEALFRPENIVMPMQGQGVKVKNIRFRGRFDAPREPDTGMYHCGSRWEIAWTEE
jgi:hypothetical protein